MRANGDGLVCPIESIVGVDVAAVHMRSMDWAVQIGLAPTELARNRLATTHFADLASRAYPHASVADRALVTGWLIYVAVLDDHYDARPAADMRAEFRAVNAYVDAGHYPRSPLWWRRPVANPLRDALADLWTRTAAKMPGTWRLRFGRSLATFLDGVYTEATFRLASRRPSLEEYLGLRRATSACGLLFDLIQLAAHQPLPDAVHFHPAVEEMRTTAVDVVAWINDIASMDKEEAAGADHNLVLVLRRTGGLSTGLARAVAIDMVNDGIRRLFRDAAVLPELGPGLGDYVDGLKHWVRANIDWSAESGRYQVRPEPGPDAVTNVDAAAR
jgi:hypothetical protein